MDRQYLEQEFSRSYARGEFGRVIFRCDQFLAHHPEEPWRSLLLCWKGMMFTVSGSAWQGQALACFREGLEAAGAGDPIKARIMAGLAKIYSEAGDCDAFTRLIPTFRRATSEAGPQAQMWGMFFWQNHGTALHNAFRFTEAVRAFTRAASIARRFGNSEMEGRCHHDVSWSELELNHPAKAARAMARAKDLFPDAAWGHKKCNVQAAYLLAMGDPSGALRQIQAALAHPRIDTATRADVYFTWARVLQVLGNRKEAGEKTLAAMDFAMKSANCPVLTKANRLLHELDWPPRLV